MSDHRVEIVPITLEKHPNADSLSIVNVFDGYTCCVRTEDWQGITKGAFIPPDSIVPDTPEYAWLGGHRRIRAKKLRGMQSYGLMVPAPDGAEIGEDVAERLGILHYVPEVHVGFKGGYAGENPPIAGEKYDIDNWLKYRRVFFELQHIADCPAVRVAYSGVAGAAGETSACTCGGLPLEVTITEKIHGTNARFTYQDGRMWCGSRSFYRKDEGKCVYWDVMRANPWIELFCQQNPGAVLYGEIFGWVQKLRYGAKGPGDVWFRLFDVYQNGRYWNWPDEFLRNNSAWNETVPVLYRGPYSEEIVTKLTVGKSTLPNADHLREGVVVKPTTEMWHRRVGRVILKSVSPEYLEKV